MKPQLRIFASVRNRKRASGRTWGKAGSAEAEETGKHAPGPAGRKRSAHQGAVRHGHERSMSSPFTSKGLIRREAPSTLYTTKEDSSLAAVHAVSRRGERYNSNTLRVRDDRRSIRWGRDVYREGCSCRVDRRLRSAKDPKGTRVVVEQGKKAPDYACNRRERTSDRAMKAPPQRARMSGDERAAIRWGEPTLHRNARVHRPCERDRDKGAEERKRGAHDGRVMGGRGRVAP